jgi:arylsulfatase A-like enzyme
MLRFLIRLCGAGRLALALWLLLSAAADAAARPNVVFIMTDQQFAGALSCRMGNRYLNTPAMDSLAAGGMVFTRAHSANPLCMPSRNSIFTGRYPHETQVTSNDSRAKLDPKEFVCMGTYFRKAGYETAYFGKWHLAYNVANINAHGFQTVQSPKAKGKQPNHDGITADGAARFLAEPHPKPFLLVVSFLNPHNICEYARRAAGMPDQVLSCGEVGTPPATDQLPPAPANLEPPKNEPDGMSIMRKGYHAAKAFPVGAFTTEDWRQQRWGYYRMIEKVDAEIGKVLAALRRAGLEDNTLVVFTSDHGECAGAHRFNQKTVLYEESVRVPLIVACKGKTAPAACDKLVNTGVDILPTMLQFAGLDIPKHLPGRSLWPLASGQAVRQWREFVVVQNNMTQTGELEGFKPEMEGRMVRTERYKYCVYSRGVRRESLVDLKADPGERNDLATDPAFQRVLLQHRELLAGYGREHHDPLVAELLADNVKPRPFNRSPEPNRQAAP